MKRVFFSIIALFLLTPLAAFALQQSPAPRIEITGVNPSQLPTVTVTANVYDRVGQPVYGLTIDNFTLTGELADKARIVSVENLSDESLSFNVVLAIDTSSSMTGAPIEKAKEAATAFINSIGPNDPVAIVAFDTTERLVQDFTTDKNVLLSAITNLAYGGKTALYDGSLLAVQKAGETQPRRAVILLSDGAEFGGRSDAERGGALTEALRQGVPVYTIGLGYGTDRTFLKELAEGTNAQNYESPTPEELLSIYQGLAATLRSQYTITIAADVPADGTVYKLDLQATTATDTLTASADLRAPIPVPIVSLTGLPGEALSETTDVTVDVKADDALTSAGYTLNGGVANALSSEPPYTITLDPVTLPPGSNNLTFTVTDETGDTQTVSQDFNVASLPSNVTIQGLPTEPLSQPQTLTLDVTGQTIGQSATYSVDGGEGTTTTDVPYSFTLDPYQIAPGDHVVSVDLLNQGGVTTTVESPFTVAALPPVIALSGVEAGQTIDAPTTLTVTTTSSQTPVQEITAQIGDTALAGQTDGSFNIDPAAFAPGQQTVTVTVTDSSGQSTTQTVNVEIAALEPTVTLSGIQAGETLDENRTVTASVAGQTDVNSVTYSVDGTEIEGSSEAPFTVDLDVLALGPGPHILSVEAELTSGQTGTADAAFVISDGPSLTATASVPTSTPRPSNTPAATATTRPTNTAVVQASNTPVPVTETSDQTGGATDTPAAQANPPTSDASGQASATAQPATATSQPPSATATVDITATAKANAEATAAIAAVTLTSDAQFNNEMLTQQAISVAQSQLTLEARQTVDAQSTANALSTRNAQASATALAARNASATANAEATDNAQASATAEQTEEATAEATAEVTEVSPSAEPTEVAQAGVTPTGAATETPGDATAAPTFTQIPLTAETQTAATNNNILPIAVICIVGLLVLLIVFLVAGRRRRQDTTRR